MNAILYSCPQCYAEFELADDAASVCPECGHGRANDADALRRPSLAGSTDDAKSLAQDYDAALRMAMDALATGNGDQYVAAMYLRRQMRKAAGIEYPWNGGPDCRQGPTRTNR